MSSELYSGLGIKVRHVPDDNAGPFESMAHALAAGHDTLHPVTGVLQFGVELDGHFVVLATRKAPGQLADIARAKAAQASQQQQPAAE